MDIVERLRERSRQYVNNQYNFDALAADEIEQLRKKNAELKELLQATVDYTGAFVSSPDISFYPSHKWHLATNDKTTGGE